MTQSQPLGIPQAVIIKSHPTPSTRLQVPNKPTGDNYKIWKEWNTNPAKHGPERVRLPPIFLPSQQVYDDLGRSSVDGVGVDVDSGEKGKRKGNGEEVADWYLTLSRGGSPGLGTSSTTSSSRSTKDNPHCTTGTPQKPDSITELTLKTNTIPIPEIVKTKASTQNTTPKQLLIPRREWFIRKALATSSQNTSTPTPTAGPSISNLLKIVSTQPRTAPANYVLGPDNKGYKLLKDRLGWEGGGLGRPEGWEGDERMLDKGKSREKSPVEVDRNGNTVVDLTADSDSDSDIEDEYRKGGPGRTAPIATTLKIDRLGIGHRYSRSLPTKHSSSLGNGDDRRRKVTHTIQEIEAAQRRAKYGQRHGIELGKKGKIKWKERDKKDRDERKRITAALNA